MPRGKGTVYVGLCSECNQHTITVRILKRLKTDFRKLEKYCNVCFRRTPVKLKEEKHSS